MQRDAQYWIDELGLAPHPEGGFYRETYRSNELIPQSGLPERFTGDRAFSTAIFFLLPSDSVSALHCIRQDELWHFHAGAPLAIHAIDRSGDYTKTVVGNDPSHDHVLQAVVPAGALFGAEVETPGAFALVGCTVAPGFDFDDFDMPSRADLIRQFPAHEALITRLTHG